MKKLLIVLKLTLFVALFASESATDIVKKATDVLTPNSAVSKQRMTITTDSGDKREFEMESFSKDRGEKTLVKYTKPSRVKGQANLMLNNADDIWTYFPRTNRVRKLATHAKKQKVQGSDFSYEDMGSGDSFVDDFSHSFLKDKRVNGVNCYKIEMAKKKNVESAYAKIVIYISKEDFVMMRADYYGEDAPDFVEKSLFAYDFKVVDKIPTAHSVVMKNLIDETETQLEILEIAYDVALDDKMFTERELKR